MRGMKRAIPTARVGIFKEIKKSTDGRRSGPGIRPHIKAGRPAPRHGNRRPLLWYHKVLPLLRNAQRSGATQNFPRRPQYSSPTSKLFFTPCIVP
ncbi:unnamed protein product [Ectocarpus sp. 13 AM-2016]